MRIARLVGCITFVAFSLIGCRERPELDGDWDGDDWGNVKFVGLRGNYSSTFGSGPGEILLKESGKGAYEGTWGEGPKRHGRLTVRFESPDALVGEWTADSDSTLQGQAGGLIRWNRRKSQ